jgi:hypothetical protein
VFGDGDVLLGHVLAGRVVGLVGVRVIGHDALAVVHPLEQLIPEQRLLLACGVLA